MTGEPPAQVRRDELDWSSMDAETREEFEAHFAASDPITLDPSTFLPDSTLWSRVAAAGVEPVVVQPGNFAGSPLTAALCLRCRTRRSCRS